VRVLLVSANRERLPDPVFPLGLAYVAGAAEQAGHDVHCVDLCFAELEPEQVLAQAVEQVAPEVIGFSLRNIDDTSYPETTAYARQYRELLHYCRRLTDAPVVVGGAAFTIMPQQFMEYLKPDFGVVGEGEATFCELLRWFAQGRRHGQELPPGVMSPGRPFTARPRPDQWHIVAPARHHFSCQQYYDFGGMLNVQTRRGCPFNCSYCTYPAIEGRRLRLRPLGEVVDELAALVEHQGARHFFLVDSVFNCPTTYAKSFCRELIDRQLDLSWTCYANAGYMDGELIELMKRSGCDGVEFGTDALVDELLDELGKGFSFAQVQEASRLCIQEGLRFCHFVFLGAPGEQPDQTQLTIDRLASLSADSSMIMVGLRIFPGTGLADRACAELGLTSLGLEPSFYVSPAVAPELQQIVADVIETYPNWVLPGFRRNFDARIQAVVRRAGRRGVAWDFLSPR
jgi:radical SAM superfamily enzyme YgiQ (UPF0313 family)